MSLTIGVCHSLSVYPLGPLMRAHLNVERAIQCLFGKPALPLSLSLSLSVCLQARANTIISFSFLLLFRCVLASLPHPVFYCAYYDRVAAYCSEGCLEVSWKRGHMSRCKQVDQLQGAPIATEGVMTSTATKTPPSTPSSTACPPPRTLVLKLKTGADLNQISEAHETNLSGQGSVIFLTLSLSLAIYLCPLRVYLGIRNS
jgi:hypothetical protein